MNIDETEATAASQLDHALKLLVSVVKDGLEHGFFDYAVSGEIVNGRKRRLTIKAGKSHQFTIPEEEIKN